MFTGIVQKMGRVSGRMERGGDLTFEIETDTDIVSRVNIGDSVCVNGVCLTAVESRENTLRFDVSVETLQRTHMAKFQPGCRVNLELAMTPSTPFGGHLVTGHVDGLGRLASREDSGRSVEMRFDAERSVAPFVAEKGSICVDGVSLTVNQVVDRTDGVSFEINIVPHTLKETTLGTLKVGDPVHLEVDLVARYLRRFEEVEDFEQSARSENSSAAGKN
jgi:riboflavin synthase